MRPAPESEGEHFRADVHGLGVWSLAVILGLGLLALAAAAGMAPPGGAASQPMAYRADKPLTGAAVTDYAS